MSLLAQITPVSPYGANRAGRASCSLNQSLDNDIVKDLTDNHNRILNNNQICEPIFLIFTHMLS